MACSRQLPISLRPWDDWTVPKGLPYSSHRYHTHTHTYSHIQGRARQLLSAGITTPHLLATFDPDSLCDMVDNLFPKQAKKLIHAAKVSLLNSILYIYYIMLSGHCSWYRDYVVEYKSSRTNFSAIAWS